MSSETTIILCAGTINYINLPISTNVSNSMIPINGKPVIGLILDDLLHKKINNITIILRNDDKIFENFLTRSYSKKMNLKLVPVKDGGSIITSLEAGFKTANDNDAVRIILGDTLIKDDFSDDSDFVYVGSVEYSKRWCYVLVNDHDIIYDFIDKSEKNNLTNLAISGYYYIRNGDFLKKCVKESLMENKKELSDVLKKYAFKYPIKIKKVSEWYDFGHIDNLITAKQKLLRTRFFNSISIDPVLNTITKISENNDKLQDELNWYFSLPYKLKMLTPRTICNEKDNNKVQIVQEYYGYPTLAELYLYSNLNINHWKSILKHVLRVHDVFRTYTTGMEPTVLDEMYINKTCERVNQLLVESDYWRNIFSQKYIYFNDQVLPNYSYFEPLIKEKVQNLKDSFDPCIIHGDLCFSNILFDETNNIVRLIDPRGNFGVKGIYGDPRYDIAKLRHSICGFYDHIVSDMFEISENGNHFKAEIFNTSLSEKIISEFDILIEKKGYNLKEIKFIEGLLFISMLPLHRDRPDSQKMMYLTGLQRLKEVFI